MLNSVKVGALVSPTVVSTVATAKTPSAPSPVKEREFNRFSTLCMLLLVVTRAVGNHVAGCLAGSQIPHSSTTQETSASMVTCGREALSQCDTTAYEHIKYVLRKLSWMRISHRSRLIDLVRDVR